jgi:dipeptidyl aminopeptidase/acylaminoacyl peptidase
MAEGAVVPIREQPMKLERLTLLLALAISGQTAAVDERTANNGQVVMQNVPEIDAGVVEDLHRYQNVRSAAFLDFSADSQSLFVRTRFAEVRQIHRLDVAGGARHQLTFFDEPVGGVERQPSGKLLSYTMDIGGSEFNQIFLFDPDSGVSRMVTDGESRNGVVTWDRNGRRMAYQSTRRNGQSNDIWMMDIDHPDKAQVVLESPDGSWWGAIDFSPDGSSLLVEQYISVTDSRVHLVDLNSGERRLLAGGATAPSANYGSGFDHTGKGFWYTSDHRGEFTQLYFRGLEPGAVSIPVTAEIPWNVSGFQLSDDGSRAAFTTNEEGYSRVYLLDPASRKYRVVTSIPIGRASGLTFSPDGKRLAMTLNTPSTPSDTFVLELGDGPLDHGDLVRWTFSEVGGLNTASFVQPELVRYATFDQFEGHQRTTPAFIYKPRAEGPHPVIIYIHGGPEGQYRPGFSSTFQLWVSKLGVAVVAPNVRGSSGYGKTYVAMDNGFKREESVRDIGALLDWIETRPDLDSTRVAVYGGSYGGYMVLASAVHYSDRLKAAVDIVGISNFVTFLENTQDYRRDLRRVEYGDERDPAMRAHLEKISPLNQVDKIKVPLFVAQGQNDPRVPVTEAEQIVAAVRAAGHSVWYMNALNEGHGYARKENQDLYRQAVVMFFRRHLLDQAGTPAASDEGH